jgi:hypothetical protein
MKTFTDSAESLMREGYVIKSNGQTLICSPHVQYFGLLNDSEREEAWEIFGTPDLPAYFRGGLQKFRLSLNAFSDLDKAVSEEAEKELLFMLESLLQARRLMMEVQSERRV